MPKRYPPAWHRVLARSEWMPSGCLEYRGCQDTHGYGQISDSRPDGSRTHKAYRVVYEVVVGPTGTGFDLHHRCHNRLCVNPFHLVATTRAQHREEHRPTHCKHGHEFTPENTYWHPKRIGQRHCLTCERERERKRAVRRNTPCRVCGSSPTEQHAETCRYSTSRLRLREAA